jgi:homoserine kinase type II
MAVFTEVSDKDARELLRRMSLGSFKELRGIQGGIENTNYFLTTDQGEWVLTLFERLSAEQLPFYLYLMKHLAQAGIPVPDPQGETRSGDILLKVCGKPASIVNRLAGKSQLAPAAVHCAAVGDMLARMHLAGQDYNRQQPNLRGLPWWNETVPVVLPHLGEETAAMLRAELAYQNHIAASASYAALPRGPVHADLFRDNVMFDGDRLTGFSTSISRAWTPGSSIWRSASTIGVSITQQVHDAERAKAMLAAYQAVRPLTAARARVAQRPAACRRPAFLDLPPLGLPSAA